MKVAITGCNSTLARSLISVLSNTSSIEKIVGIDWQPYRGVYNPKLQFVQADIRDISVLPTILQGCDAVFHLAFIVLPTITDISTIVEINIIGSRKVFVAAAKAGVRQIIYTSSVAAYGFVPSLPDRIPESSPKRGNLNTSFYYPFTKAIVEQELDQFERAHPEIIITRLRPHIILGPNFAQFTDNFTGIFRQLESTSRIYWAICHCDKGRALLQLTHELDLVNFMLFTLQHRVGGAFNIAGKPIDLESYIASKVKFFWRIPWTLVYSGAWIASFFSKEWRLRLPWLTGAKYQLIMDCSKIHQSGFLYPIHSTQEIIDEVLIFRKKINTLHLPPSDPKKN